MAIVVTNLGTVLNGAGAATTTFTIPAGGVPAGALICVGIMEGFAAGQGTMSDNVNGAYTLGVSNTASGAAIGAVALFYFPNSAAMAAGKIITYTQNFSGDSCVLSAFYATGIATTSPADATVTNSATGSSTAPTVTSGSASVAGELMVGLVGWAVTGTFSFTQDSTNGAWATPPVNPNPTNANEVTLTGGTLVKAGTGTQIYHPTINTDPWAIMIMGFKPASTINTDAFETLYKDRVPSRNRPRGIFLNDAPPLGNLPSPPFTQEFDDRSPPRVLYPKRYKGDWNEDPPLGNVPSPPFNAGYDDRSPPRVLYPKRNKGTWLDDTVVFPPPIPPPPPNSDDTVQDQRRFHPRPKGVWMDDNVSLVLPVYQGFDDTSPSRIPHPRPRGNWTNDNESLVIPVYQGVDDTSAKAIPHSRPRGTKTDERMEIGNVPTGPFNQDFDDKSPPIAYRPHSRPKGTYQDDFPQQGHVPTPPILPCPQEEYPVRSYRPSPRPKQTWNDDFPPQVLSTTNPSTLRQDFSVEPPRRDPRRAKPPTMIYFDVPGKFRGGTVATVTIGTTAQTSLTGLCFSHVSADADIGAINALIKGDVPVSSGTGGAGTFHNFGSLNDYFTKDGKLYLPNRGVVQVLQGDYIAVDSQTGWPILISGGAAASNPAWVHT